MGEAPKARRRRPSALAILGGTATLVVFIVAGLLIYAATWDVPPPDDSDLLPTLAPVADSENGFAAVRGITVWKDDDHPIPAAFYDEADEAYEWNAERAREAVEKNGEALAALEEALAAPGFRIRAEEFEDLLGAKLLVNWRRLADVVLARARLELDAGKADAAISTALTVFRFGDRLTAAGGVSVTFMYGDALRQEGASALRAIFERAQPDARRSRQVLETLEHAARPPSGFIEAMRGEYQYCSRNIDTIESESDDIVTRTFTSPNHTRLLLAETIRGICRNSSVLRAQRTPPPVAAPGVIELFGLSVPITPMNPGGRTIAGEFASIVVFEDLLDSRRFHLAATRVVIALRGHQLETGELPETLDELVPEWLPEVPRDPYDGKPLRYSKERRRVWAVGIDLVDNGRTEEEGDENEPTVTFEFE